MGKKDVEDIIILDRVAREGLIKTVRFEQKPKEVKKKKHKIKYEGRVLMAEGTVNA